MEYWDNSINCITPALQYSNFDTPTSTQQLTMSKKVFCVALCAMLFALCMSADAQQPTKVPRIGFLGTSPSAIAARIEAFRRGLRDLGYVEGKNLVIDWRYAEGKLDRLPALAAELVRLKVDIIRLG